MSRTPTLAERHSDLTQNLILDSAVQILEQSTLSEVTVRAVAKHARISERTVFRYFASREEFLDAVAGEVALRLDIPPPPSTVEELVDYPSTLYARFEQKAALIEATQHSELFGRMRAVAAGRWKTVQNIVDACAPRRSERQRKLAAANISFLLTATAWHYYRFYFNLTLSETINSAQSAIRLLIDDMTRPA